MVDYSWVKSRLAIGGAIDSLFDARKLAAAGITRVLNLRMSQAEIVPVQVAGMVYYSNPMPNHGPVPQNWFKFSFDCYMRTMKEPKEKLLVHCKNGIDRSPSTAYFLLRALGTSEDDAWDHVINAHPASKMAWNVEAEKALKQLGFK